MNIENRHTSIFITSAVFQDEISSLKLILSLKSQYMSVTLETSQFLILPYFFSAFSLLLNHSSTASTIVASVNGDTVGADVGDTVGAEVGDAVGAEVGDVVGADVGDT